MDLLPKTSAKKIRSHRFSLPFAKFLHLSKKIAYQTDDGRLRAGEGNH
jgi:hypothetical protein